LIGKDCILRYFYSVLVYLGLPFFFLRLLWRSRQNPAYRQRWAERLGFCPYTLENCIWVHAVSVGEVLAAVPLINALKKQYPEIPLVVTNMTITGAARTKATWGDRVLQLYIPYDTPDAVHRFLRKIQPKIAVIMETECWPNLFAACKKQGISLVITNARLSEKSAKGYHRIAGLTREMLSAVHMLAVQSEVEATRFEALGLPKERAVVTGNIKFDLELPADLAIKSEQLRATLGRDRLIWIAASTHAGEEEIVLAAHRCIIKTYPQALLILVPRHPERFDGVFALSNQQGFQTVRRSESSICTSETNVYLGDTMGELLLLYSVSDVALVCGSFIPMGGHNMLEAAALSKPVLMGPSLFNFLEISAWLLKANGMKKVETVDELVKEVESLFQNSQYRQEMGARAYHVVEANRGALTKQLNVICSVLSV
jgi:3-deoxy-D-manno-octulosonic-acid transferase